MECLVLGDSIAVGTEQALRLQGINCSRQARVSATSTEILNYRVVSNSNIVILSVGSNDDYNRDNTRTYRRIRNNYSNSKVIWIIPRNRRLANQVIRVAESYGDPIVDLISQPSRDGAHPSSYVSLANRVKRYMGN